MPNKFWRWLFLLPVLGSLVVGCCNLGARDRFYPPLNVETREEDGNRCIDQIWKIRLAENGVQLYQMGDRVLIVLPSDLFFVRNTSVLNPKYFPALNDVAMLVCYLEKVNVKVSGYTDATGCPARSLALSRQQAYTIACFLQRRGVDARILYSVGYGECNPIACNDLPCHRTMNRRVEISFWRITDTYDY